MLGIGVDVGGSHILSAAVDLNSGAIDESTRAHVHIDSKQTSEDLMQDWARCINGTLAHCQGQDVAGIGFAMPGPFNYKEGIAMFEGNDKYEHLYGVHIASALQPLIAENLKFRYQNDASCFAMGVDGYGVAKKSKKSISITLGTGFGAAFIDDGVPIVTREDVPEDGCFWHLPFKEGIADDYFSTRWFRQAYQTTFGKEVPGVKEIAVEVAGNETAQQLFDQFGENLAGFLAPWIAKFKPDMIVMGGNISRAFDLFAPSLYRHLDTGNEISFEVSELKEDAALLGSARLLDDAFFSKLKDTLPTK